jgi:hypothetical protein
MTKALLIVVVWVSPNTYDIEHTPIAFPSYQECLRVKHLTHTAPNRRLAVIHQDIICDGA